MGNVARAGVSESPSWRRSESEDRAGGRAGPTLWGRARHGDHVVKGAIGRSCTAGRSGAFPTTQGKPPDQRLS